VEILSEKKIKILRFDNEGEYTSDDFKTFRREVGIKRELTTPYNPQQNGVAERKNRSIEESVKAMMNDQNLSMFLWGEAAMTTVYVQNRSPHPVLKNMIPKEAFFGKKPSVEHLRIFGCPIYIHVPKDKRKKLDTSGKKGIFVAYSESSKSYRIYVLSQQNVEISRYVTFDEKIAFGKSIEAMDSNDEEEHEGPKEETTCSPKHPNEEPEQALKPVEPVKVLETRKRPAWLESTLQEAERHKAPSGTFRESKRPKRFSSYASLMTSLVNTEPSTFQEAVKKEWKEAMMEEYQSIMKNDVWEIVPRPGGKFVVTSKWVYNIKHAVDESIDKYKARSMARGFSQQEGEDYDETFPSVARYTSIRAIISLVASMGWSLHQMDVKTAFLNGLIEK
jgi:hypothetical protein